MRDSAARDGIMSEVRRALGRHGTPSMPAKDFRSAPSFPSRPVSEIRLNCEQHCEQLRIQFESEATRTGARFYHAADGNVAVQIIEEICVARAAKSIVGSGSVSGIEFGDRFAQRGIEYLTDSSSSDFLLKARTADVGVSGVDYALADTGTLVLLARPSQARSVSLLPPVHIAVVRSYQILSGLSDLFPLLRSEATEEGRDLSSAITLITGPSRTADIELTLVVGVHGPQQLHILLID